MKALLLGAALALAVAPAYAQNAPAAPAAPATPAPAGAPGAAAPGPAAAPAPAPAAAATPGAPATADDAFAAALVRLVGDLAAQRVGDMGEVPADRHEALGRCMAAALAGIPADQKQAVIDYTDAPATIEKLQADVDPATSELVGACFQTAFQRPA